MSKNHRAKTSSDSVGSASSPLVLVIGKALVDAGSSLFQGLNTVMVPNGEAAMALMEHQEAALLVVASNITSPGPPEFCGWVLEQDPNHSIIVLLTETDCNGGQVALHLEAGAIDCCSLNVSQAELRARIESGLRRSYRYRRLVNKDAALAMELQERCGQLEETGRKLEEQYRELDMLDGIVGLVNREKSLKKVLERLLQEGFKLLPGARNGVFLVYNEKKSTFVFEMAVGYEMERLKTIQLPPSELGARLTARQDMLEEGIFHGRGYRGKLPIKSEVPIPMATLAMEITHGKQLKGFLIWDHPTDEHAFDHTDVRKLSRFRQHANSAVARAWFFREMTHRNDQLLSGFQYARRIQNAIQPPKKVLNHAFPEHFLIFQPKRMISSDFYWLGETDASYFLVVGDCAGHAVAGPLMTIIASRLLDTIVLKNKVRRPVAILEAVHDGLMDMLKLKHNEDTAIKIDMAVCRFSRHRRRVAFAGARRPLYWIKERNGGLRSKSLKGDRQPVGGREPAPPFTIHKLELEKGDMLYFTTDGFALQKSEGMRKFGILKLNALLQEIMPLSMEAQKARLMEAFNYHRGGEEQTDDITVMGLRF